jgi:uncharacterized protein
MQNISAPVGSRERILLLDVLRGLAIFGILMVNMQIFYRPMTIYLLGYSGSASTTNLIAELFIKFFFEGKFYVLFSMLFGYGFYLFMQKQTPQGNSIVPVFKRRLFVLLVFGVLHITLLWVGDILLVYAVFGFFLLLFRKVSDNGLIKWSAWLAMVPVIITGLLALVIHLIMLIPEAAGEVNQALEEGVAASAQLVENAVNTYSSGNFAALIAMRWTEYRIMLPGLLFFYPMVLAMFLLGTWAGRKGIIKNHQDHILFFRKLRWWSLGLGVPLSALYAWSYLHASPQVPNGITVLNTFTHIASGLLLSLFYVTTIVLLMEKGKLRCFSRWMSSVGRMALTNYLLHSIICTTLFLPYGFGLFMKINHWQGILISVFIFALQIPFSNWWLGQFRFGPFEWLWRSLTYFRWQPMMKQNGINSGQES